MKQVSLRITGFNRNVYSLVLWENDKIVHTKNIGKKSFDFLREIYGLPVEVIDCG